MAVLKNLKSLNKQQAGAPALNLLDYNSQQPILARPVVRFMEAVVQQHLESTPGLLN